MSLLKPLRTTVIPLCLILTCPVFIVLMYYIMTEYQGSIANFISGYGQLSGFYLTPSSILAACQIMAIFIAVEAVLMKFLPGRIYAAPITPKGNIVNYKDNGLLAWFVTHLFFYISIYQLHLFSPTIIYDYFGQILIVCSIFSLAFCGFLYFKGIWFPSTSDSSRTGNIVFDYYWGIELHPKIFGFDLKQLMICRLSMMGWSLIVLSFAAKQYEIYGHVSNSMSVAVILQITYIFKFFYWESGYFATIDVMHDHFGFYICWGVMAWLPCIYTSPILYLVNHPHQLPGVAAVNLLMVGLLAIYINYSTDHQRQKIRETNGNCKIWGKEPKVIVANYTTIDGQQRNSLLLYSGWWGVSRHFNYVSEITLALCWTLPCLFAHVLPYFYVVFLTILLVHRSFRDEDRCRRKYGEFWDKYCTLVPNRLIPGIF